MDKTKLNVLNAKKNCYILYSFLSDDGFSVK